MKITSEITFKWNNRTFDFSIGDKMHTVFGVKNVDVQGYEAPVLKEEVTAIVYDDKDIILYSNPNLYVTFNNVEIVASICK